MHSTLSSVTLSFVFVIVYRVNVDDTDVVVPILHAIGSTTASKYAMTLPIRHRSLLTRTLQSLDTDLVEVLQRWRVMHAWL